MPTQTLTKDERSTAPPPTGLPETETEEARGYARPVRRLMWNAVAWGLGTIVLTVLWALNQNDAHGSFEHFGNSGNPGDWNPTLLALGVGLWGLVVGIMALGVYVGRPGATRDAGVRRIEFHAAAWALGMLVLTPLWALIEWQDNGGFERWSANSQPGSWEPWIVYAGGIWAGAVTLIALRELYRRRSRR